MQIAEQGGKVIRSVYNSGDMNKMLKGTDDPVTIADLQVQKSIEACFGTHFPGLILVGEESKESLINIQSQLDPKNISLDFIKQEMLSESLKTRKDFNDHMRKEFYGAEIWENFESIRPGKEVLVWVDPLDGTNDFTKGNPSTVTVLIGLAVEGVPKVGVVHQPFAHGESGITLFGT